MPARMLRIPVSKVETLDFAEICNGENHHWEFSFRMVIRSLLGYQLDGYINFGHVHVALGHMRGMEGIDRVLRLFKDMCEEEEA